ncbi:thermonuclease family protein [Gephyromycinifex aptenodytis]|uniref:thermonuclease family protein n=1 Tax=Gephyromycinifex aptenodytis TaxID=2716227 RepID=UPI001D003CB3|nr:thermonuclease family protein [Gephyromycinifex aptenodytis]
MKVGVAAAVLAAGMVVGAGAPGAQAAGAVSAVRAPGEIVGRVTYVVDGDTVHVRVGSRIEKVRVIGVDTPELSKRQCFSTQAKAATTNLVAGKVVTLRADRTQGDRDRYHRLLRHVILPDRSSLAQRLIANGYGREYTYAKPYVGQSTFRSAQARAMKARRGVWSATCAKQGVGRPLTQAVTKPKPNAKPVAGRCTIKGNISSSGEKIYHLPGQRYYNATKITLNKGERWFCSTRDAQRAGWRPAKV